MGLPSALVEVTWESHCLCHGGAQQLQACLPVEPFPPVGLPTGLGLPLIVKHFHDHLAFDLPPHLIGCLLR